MWFTSFTTSPRTRRTILLHLSRPMASPATSPPWEPATSPWTDHPEPPPAKLTPPRPCYATTPTTQNPITGEEPSSRPQTAGSSPPRADHRSPPLAGMWARAHGAVPAVCPVGGPNWAGRARSAGPKSPPARLTEQSFSFSFSLFFPFSYIYVHILIFYAPKIVQIFFKSQNNNT
jgi:hypothetical protein